jgi:site-specific recombinase XerC
LKWIASTLKLGAIQFVFSGLSPVRCAKNIFYRHIKLRHTWASWHVQNGTPLHILKELGGWATYEMVQRYAHLAPEHLAKFAGNAKVAKSVASIKANVVNIA